MKASSLAFVSLLVGCAGGPASGVIRPMACPADGLTPPPQVEGVIPPRPTNFLGTTSAIAARSRERGAVSRVGRYDGRRGRRFHGRVRRGGSSVCGQARPVARAPALRASPLQRRGRSFLRVRQLSVLVAERSCLGCPCVCSFLSKAIRILHARRTHFPAGPRHELPSRGGRRATSLVLTDGREPLHR